jgi:hypothetical protein
LPGCDFDTVGAPQAEPPTRNLGYLVPVALDLVFVIDDVALRLHVVSGESQLHVDYVGDSALTTMVFMILSANVCFLPSHSGQR